MGQERFYDRDPHHENDQRSEFEHDRDRVLYASSFRRLAGVTQVAAADERHLLHNRLTHSLKVAQLARRMAEYVTSSYPDLSDVIFPDVAETAGLIHDIGHPPFGHAAEERLDELMSGHGGFEGNAQSFRVVTRLAVRVKGVHGLDLTRRTLDGTLKYPCCRDCKMLPASWSDRRLGKKWGVYLDDFDMYKWVRQEDGICHIDQLTPRSVPRAPEAILVDWADDVSYVTHDIEDYYRAGLIPLNDLRVHWPQIREAATARLEHDLGSSFQASEFNAAAEDLFAATDEWPPYTDSNDDRARIRTETSEHIMRFVGSIEVLVDEPPYVNILAEAQYKVEVLKSLTHYFVIGTPGLAVAQRGQAHMVETLFDELFQMASKRRASMPKALQELLDDGDYEDERAVCDYVASLTEAQAVDLHSRLTSAGNAQSIFGTWF